MLAFLGIALKTRYRQGMHGRSDGGVDGVHVHTTLQLTNPVRDCAKHKSARRRHDNDDLPAATVVTTCFPVTMPPPRVTHSSRRLRVPRKKGLRCGIPALLSIVVALYVLLVLSSSRIKDTPTTSEEGVRKAAENVRKSKDVLFKRKAERKVAQKPRVRGVDTAVRGDASNIHILFSTSCSSSQDWQSYLLFHSLMKMKQTGTVTRLVSGCTPEQREHQEEILRMIQTTMSPQFNTFFTELDFGKKFSLKGGDWHQYKYFNKPFSTLAFFEEVLGYPDSTAHDDDIIVLIDPDMMAMRSFENDFSDFLPESAKITRISHGQMFGQPFGYNTQWYEEAKDNLTYLVGETSPVHNLKGRDLTYYHAGPPYMGTGKDFYSLVKTWCDILPKYQELRQHFMVEMYSASLAAAHLGYPFHLVSDFMISDDLIDNEGWSGVDNADPEDLCMAGGVKHLALVFHYCQRFGLGEFFFNKHIFNNNFFSCEEPLIVEPPKNVALAYNYSHYGDGSNKTWVGKDYKYVKRNAFMLCSMISGLNDAATFYKQHHCGDDANYEKTWSFHEAKARGEIGKRKR